jgi:uncharacterized protein YceK
MKLSLIFVIVVSGIMLLSGCGAMNSMTGKKELETKVASLEQQLAASKSEEGKLRNTMAKLEQELSAEKAKSSRDTEEFQKKLDQAKVKGMPVILFGGDIVYEIATEGYKDYRAGLRYRSLLDDDFKTAFEQFEAGKGGDAIVLGILKEIDKSGDKVIDLQESLRFRKAEEEKYMPKRGK